MAFPTSFKTIEIMQQCKYGFTPEFVEDLCSNWSSVKDYAWVKHDKDFNEDGSRAEDHIHLMLRFTGSVPTSAILAKLKGVCEVQHLQKMKSWKQAIAYLTHANAPGKHKYSDSEVHSNFDWQTDRDDAVSKVDPKKIVELIDAGIMREYNKDEFISNYDYSRNKALYENAFKFRSDRLKRNAKEMETLKCMWLSGEAGTGKTEFATFLAASMGKDYYVTESGNDPFGGYLGQPVIIMDDVRPEQFAASTLLKLLDPNTRSGVKSRYRNKWLEVDLIIVTNPFPPETWWEHYRLTDSKAGSWEQLTRRITFGAYSMRRDGASVVTYNDDGSRQMRFEMDLPEDFLQKMRERKKQEVEAQVKLETFIPGAKFRVEGKVYVGDQELMDGFRKLKDADHPDMPW